MSSIDWSPITNWAAGKYGGPVNNTTATNLANQMDTFLSRWASVANKINTQGYALTQSDVNELCGSGSTSIATLISNLENTCGNYIQANADVASLNCAVGGSGTTPFPTNPDQTKILQLLSNEGIAAPNNPGWTHYGNGWNDYLTDAQESKEGIGWAEFMGGCQNGLGAAISQYGSGSWPWTILPGTAQQIAIHTSSDIWALSGATTTGGYEIYHWNGSVWSKITGGLTTISVGSDGEVWGLNNVATTGGYEVYRWNGSSFVLQTGGLTRIYVASANYIWGVNNQGHAFLWNGSGWTDESSGPIGSFSVDDAGAAWATIGNVPYQWNGSSFVQHSLPAGLSGGQIFVCGSGIFVEVTENSKLYTWGGSSWSALPAAPNASASSTYYVGQDGSVWSYLSDSSLFSTSFGNIYKYVSGVWQDVSGSWWMKILVIAKNGNNVQLHHTSNIYQKTKNILIKAGLCGTWPCRLYTPGAVIWSAVCVYKAELYNIISIGDIPVLPLTVSVAAAVAGKEALIAAVLAVFSASMASICDCDWSTVWGK